MYFSLILLNIRILNYFCENHLQTISMKKFVLNILLSLWVINCWGQNAKVQTAWRNLEDYRNSKDVFSLNKAKEAIDLASNYEDTKEKAKTWMYRATIYYEYFRLDKKEEEKKYADVKDKDEKQNKVYANVSPVHYQESAKALLKVLALDKDKAFTTTPEFGMLAVEVNNDLNFFAVAKYMAGKFDEAMDYFNLLYDNSKMGGRKDTALLTNALLCASKAKNPEKMKFFCEKMITEKVATPYSYYALYQSKDELKDSVGALNAVKEGRKIFPADLNLLNAETDDYLRHGKGKDALANLEIAIQKQPNVAIFYIAKGSIYFDMANPKKDAKGAEPPVPANYDELVTLAETNYKKACELEPKNADPWESLGANYNNWGAKVRNGCDANSKVPAKVKECEAKAIELFKNAISSLEKALEIKPKDKSIMSSLRKLYLYTDQPEKATKMTELIKAK